jgi:ABC-type amino acid transport system permease subunit
MVASGFDAGRTEVSPYRLVIHLGLALVIYCALLWTALGLLRPGRDAPAAALPVRRMVQVTFWCVAAAMLAGGFVAGIRAGFTYNTFPLMDGRLVPEGYLDLAPWWKNATANIAAVQFNHRLLATLAGLVAVGAVWAAFRRLPDGFARRAVIGLGLAVAGLSRWMILRQSARFYIEIVRGIPIMVLLLYIAFAAAPALVIAVNWVGNWFGFDPWRTRDFPLIARAITPTESPIRFHARFFQADAALTEGKMEATPELADLAYRPLAEALKLPMFDITEAVVRHVQTPTADEPAFLFTYRNGGAKRTGLR